MTFASPQLLVALIAVPLAAVGLALLEAARRRHARTWSNPDLLPNMVRRPSRRFGALPTALFLVGLIFLLVGFARPQRVLGDVKGSSPTIVLAFDTSGSMASTDVAPTRIRAARSLAARFLDDLPSGYRVGVVTFANAARVLLAPTTSRPAALAKIPATVTPLGGTSIGDGISESVALVLQAVGTSGTERQYRPGAVLLFSDGAQTAGGTTEQEAAVDARADGVPVDTVGVGTRDGSVTQHQSGAATPVVIPVPVDPKSLAEISQASGGTFFGSTIAGHSVPASAAKLKNVYAQLESHASPGTRRHNLSAPTAAVALAFILGGIVLSGLWYGRLA